MHRDETAQREGFEPKLCFAIFFRPQGRSKTNHELGDSHTKFPGRPEVTPFVETDGETKSDHEREHAYNKPDG